jgi:Domain of unknown function (DUF6458)
VSIGGSLLLVAVGAILKWAVTAHVSGLDLQTVGTILFVVGLVGLVLSLAYTFWWASSRRREAEVVDPRQPPTYR